MVHTVLFDSWLLCTEHVKEKVLSMNVVVGLAIIVFMHLMSSKTETTTLPDRLELHEIFSSAGSLH